MNAAPDISVVIEWDYALRQRRWGEVGIGRPDAPPFGRRFTTAPVLMSRRSRL